MTSATTSARRTRTRGPRHRRRHVALAQRLRIRPRCQRVRRRPQGAGAGHILVLGAKRPAAATSVSSSRPSSEPALLPRRSRSGREGRGAPRGGARPTRNGSSSSFRHTRTAPSRRTALASARVRTRAAMRPLQGGTPRMTRSKSALGPPGRGHTQRRRFKRCPGAWRTPLTTGYSAPAAPPPIRSQLAARSREGFRRASTPQRRAHRRLHWPRLTAARTGLRAPGFPRRSSVGLRVPGLQRGPSVEGATKAKGRRAPGFPRRSTVGLRAPALPRRSSGASAKPCRAALPRGKSLRRIGTLSPTDV
mmetsp:Transcript_100307/g.282978  ORF Transcript_100307/g.282978 Transcript_100307/m.282978 type:complete len:306 (-) Transcript_100307:93-1010(-)